MGRTFRLSAWAIAAVFSLLACGEGGSDLDRFTGVWEPTAETPYAAEAYRGDAHCNTENTVTMVVRHPSVSPWWVFLRDPEGEELARLLPGQQAPQPFSLVSDLPPDAFSSSLKNGEAELFLVPSMDAAYISHRDTIERWPTIPVLKGCD